MNIQPITPSTPLCLGVCCSIHRSCQRYLRIDSSSPDALRIDNCGADHPLYIPAPSPAPRMPLIEAAAQTGCS